MKNAIEVSLQPSISNELAISKIDAFLPAAELRELTEDLLLLASGAGGEGSDMGIVW